MSGPPRLEDLKDSWRGRWAAALAPWSRFTKLMEPRWCLSSEEARQEGLSESFAMIRLNDQAVVIDLDQIAKRGLGQFAVQILAHEIGHHVYCPSNLRDHGRMIARMRAALPSKEAQAPLIANLYADLLINDRLQRSEGLDMASVYRALPAEAGAVTRTWTLYMRIYEILWSLRKSELASGEIDARTEGDAQLGARLVRTYARDWLDGSGRFAALLLPYLMEDEGVPVERLLRGWMDTRGAGGSGEVPAGLTEIEDDEAKGAVHPALDPELSGLDADPVQDPPRENAGQGGSAGQRREPFEYGQILRSLGLELTDHEIAVRYYRERAAPHLVRYPQRRLPESTEPLVEGFQTWDIGSPVEDVDWFGSVIASPRVVPGVTTVQRVYGASPGGQPEWDPVDLDIYVDCSGSMPNPQMNVSYLALAGAIVALSALRVGARVQATLWSGANQFETTGGFVSDSEAILRILSGYLGGATAFPIHLLRDTYANRKAADRPVHVMVISDDGVDTMFARDERGNSGWDVARAALDRCRAGGTLVLNLYREIEEIPDLVRARAEGWQVHRVRSWEELVAFAAAFSKAAYEEKADAAPGTAA